MQSDSIVCAAILMVAFLVVFFIAFALCFKLERDRNERMLNGVGIRCIKFHEIRFDDTVTTNWYEIIWKEKKN